MNASKSTRKVKKKQSTINMIKCTMCSKIFKDKYAMYNHQAVHSTDSPYKCTICEYAGKRPQYLRRHMKVSHGGKKEFECDICGKTFHFGCKLKSHMKVHTGEKPYRCEECGKAFNALYSLNTHKFIHTNEKPYRCLYCAYACRDSSTLRKHQMRHTGSETVYQCKTCDVTCKSKSNLKLHVAEKHLEIDVRKFECEICAKRFKKKTNLAIHIQAVHERSRTGKCEVCGLLITNRANLPAHMRTHISEKPYLCTVEKCEKRFNNSSSLHKHMQTHSTEKRYSCPVCRKGFMKKDHLERHRNTHKPKVKRVQCDYCGVRFLNKAYLTNHILRKHGSTEKTYTCDACGLTTTNKPGLVMHLKGRHRRMFLTKCKHCEKKFLRATYLQRHCRSIHNIEYDIPKRRKKNKPKKVKIKEEPLEEIDDLRDLIDLEPKEEPMDEEDMVLSNLAAAESQMEKIPEEVFEELIDPLTRKPDCSIRPKLDYRRKASSKYSIDKDSETLMRERIKRLLEETRRKKAALSLERARRKYNRLMRRALLNAPVKGRLKVEYYKNKDSKQNDNAKSRKEASELLTEHFSIDHGSVDTDKVINEVEETNARNNHDSQDTRRKEITIIDQNNGKRKSNRNVAHESNKGKFIDVDEEIDGGNEKVSDVEQDNRTGEGEARETEVGRNKKLKLNIHQCYVCFKLFETKETLQDHCKVHFDVCNVKTWKKCPLCQYSTNISITRHLKLVHNIDIQIPYATFKDDNVDILKSKYYYDVGDEIIDKVEIIPSLKNLNREQYKKIDKTNRLNKDKGVTRNKLVKKGKEWIVVQEKVKIKDCMLPKLDESTNLNVKGGYIEHMKELYRVAKKKGVQMLFPCDACEKVCQTLSALKLHGRKHQVNPKPFKPKVWKHKTNKNKNVVKQNTKAVKTIIRKDTELPKLDRRTKQAQNEAYREANRISKPKPIVHKHKCDEELKVFYENNIKGGDIEFWQFLKIYNKMCRDNINDFSDLERIDGFGLHSDMPVGKDTEVEKENTNDTSKKVSDSMSRKLARKKARLNKIEFEKRRNEAKKRLREKLRKEMEGRN